MNKKGLAAFFNADEDDPPLIPQKSVDDLKLSQFTQGPVKKSKRDKEREAAEAKRREEEEETAKAYAEYLDTFDADGVSKSKKTGFVKAGGKEALYPSQSGGHRKFDSYSPSPEPAGPGPKGKGKRAMDAFLEELKRDEAERETKLRRRADAHGKSVSSLVAYENQTGSRDRGDPATSNIFVANLPPNITESVFGNFFAKLGPVGSVKIMWPRGDNPPQASDGRRPRSGLSGFVSYMKRRDAEVAVREMDGHEWQGHILRVGWSKAVPIAAKATYGVERPRSLSPSRSRSRSSDRRYPSESRSRSPRRNWSRSPSRERYPQHRRGRSYRRSQSPRRPRFNSPDRDLDPEEETFIRIVAHKVKQQGQEFEEVLKSQERGRSKFMFLWDEKSPGHRYYRSLLGSSKEVRNIFDDEGYNSIYSTDSAEESEKERTRKGRLGKYAKKRFEAMLRGLTGRRGDLARCMAFSLEHADAAIEIVDLIVASLLVDGTPVPRKVARLYLICDILHNSAASIPNAWKFRQEFQSRLGLVFDHLSTIYHSFPGRITAGSFKAQILAVIEVWEDWIVFPAEMTTELRNRLEGLRESSREVEDLKAEVANTEPTPQSLPSRFKASSFKPAEFKTENELAAAKDSPAASEAMSLESGSDIDIDGKPLDDNVDGEPMEDVDGEPMDDVDGEPIDDVDGEAMDDVDGEPLGEAEGNPMD